MNLLLSAPPTIYFTKRLTNEGIHKRAINFVEKFAKVHDMLKAFLKLKY